MSIPATEAVVPALSGLTAGIVKESAAAEDKQMFLELMVAQLRYQDPLNPTDSAEFLAQSAQFTALEKMQEVADQSAAMVSAQLAFGASGLVGREVSYLGADGVEQTGSVTGVSFGAEGPTLDLAGTTVTLGQVLTVTAGAGAAAPTSTSTTTGSTVPGTSPA